MKCNKRGANECEVFRLLRTERYGCGTVSRLIGPIVFSCTVESMGSAFAGVTLKGSYQHERKDGRKTESTDLGSG